MVANEVCLGTVLWRCGTLWGHRPSATRQDLIGLPV